MRILSTQPRFLLFPQWPTSKSPLVPLIIRTCMLVEDGCRAAMSRERRQRHDCRMESKKRPYDSNASFVAAKGLWDLRQERRGRGRPKASGPVEDASHLGMRTADSSVVLGYVCHRDWSWRPIQLLVVRSGRLVGRIADEYTKGRKDERRDEDQRGQIVSDSELCSAELKVHFWKQLV